MGRRVGPDPRLAVQTKTRLKSLGLSRVDVFGVASQSEPRAEEIAYSLTGVKRKECESVTDHALTRGRIRLLPPRALRIMLASTFCAR